MRRFKIFLWIFIVFLLQTVVVSHIHIFGAVPSLVISYMMCVVIMENEFRNAVIISSVCAAAMGALSGREFVIMTLAYVYSSICVFRLRKKPAYISNFQKSVIWTFVVSAVIEILYFTIMNWSINLNVLLYDALPTAVLNILGTIIIYPVLKRTMYREEKKKLLIV